jgi:hypothetical protein
VWRRRGTSPAAPRGNACQPSTASPALSRTVRRLGAPPDRHSRSSSTASGPVPCSRYCKVAAAVERPAIEVAGPAPPIAGLRRARMGSLGLASKCSCGLSRTGSRREGASVAGLLGLPTETPTSRARWVSRCCVRPVCRSGSGERWPGNGVRRSPATACWPASHRQPAPGRSPRCSTPIRGDRAARRRPVRRGSGTRG